MPITQRQIHREVFSLKLSNWKKKKENQDNDRRLLGTRLTLFVQLSLIVTIGHTWLQYGAEWHALTHWRLNWFHPGPSPSIADPRPATIVATQHGRLQINCEIRGNRARIMAFVLRERSGWFNRGSNRPSREISLNLVPLPFQFLLLSHNFFFSD